MPSMNKVFLMGNLGKDPDTKYLQNGTAVTTFSMATTEKGKDGEQRTDWHQIVAYSKLAENAAKYLKKGQPVMVFGKVRYREWEDKDGNKRRVTEIIASEMQFLRGASQSEKENSEPRDDYGQDTPF